MTFFSFDQIETISEKIRTAFNIPSDEYFINISKLASDIGINVKEVEFENDDIAGSLEVSNSNRLIKVNSHDNEERKRFTIAHELSHYILHHKSGDLTYIDFRQSLEFYKTPEEFKKEYQANMLAAALLMPSKLVKKEFDLNPDVDDLASLFHVSKKAAVVRLETLGLLD